MLRQAAGSAVICGDSTIPERGLGDLGSPTRNTDRARMDELTFRPSFAYALAVLDDQRQKYALLIAASLIAASRN